MEKSRPLSPNREEDSNFANAGLNNQTLTFRHYLLK